MSMVHIVGSMFNVALGTRTLLFQGAFNVSLPILGHSLHKIKITQAHSQIQVKIAILELR